MTVFDENEIVRDLIEADVRLLAHKRAAPNDAPIKLTKRLSTRHHELARRLAEGMENWRAAAFTGYDEGYVSILKSDPTFWNLVLFYKENREFEFKRVDTKLADLTMDALESLHDKLEANELTANQALAVAQLGLDRTGYGPAMNHAHKHEHVVGMADRMEAARLRVIEGKKVDDGST